MKADWVGCKDVKYLEKHAKENFEGGVDHCSEGSLLWIHRNKTRLKFDSPYVKNC
jgi:hypothetical protein